MVAITLAWRLVAQLVGQLGDLAVLHDPGQVHLGRQEPAGQQRRAPAKEDGRGSYDDLVEPPLVGKGSHQLTPADQPYIGPLRRLDHRDMDQAHVAGDEGQVRARYRGKLTMSKHPAGLVTVVVLPLLGLLQQPVVAEYPLVGGRAVAV